MIDNPKIKKGDLVYHGDHGRGLVVRVPDSERLCVRFADRWQARTVRASEVRLLP